MIGRKFKSRSAEWKVVEKNLWQGGFWVRLVSGKFRDLAIGDDWMMSDTTVRKHLKNGRSK